MRKGTMIQSLSSGLSRLRRCRPPKYPSCCICLPPVNTASMRGYGFRSSDRPGRSNLDRLPYFSSICLGPLIYSLPMVESSSLSSASIAEMAASLHVNGTCFPPPPRRLFRHRSPCPDPDFSLKALGKALYKTASRLIFTVSSFATHMTQKRKLFSFG